MRALAAAARAVRPHVGRKRNRVAEQAQRGVYITLVADVAQSYLILRELDLELEIGRRTLRVNDETIEFYRRRLLGGVSNQLELDQAVANRSRTASTIPEIERQIVTQENLINFLLGRNPGPIPRGAALTDQYYPPSIPTGLPSALLERRPDIRQAEQSLQSFNSLVGVARANMFPQFSLTGLLGVASDQLTGLSAGAGNTYSFGAGLTAPIFQGGRLRGNYELAKQQYQESKISYEKSVQSSFREVADALVQDQKLRELRTVQERQVEALQRSVHLSSLRYSGGLSSYLEVLDAQRGLFSAQIALAQTRGNQLQSLVQLYRALGGGWQQ